MYAPHIRPPSMLSATTNDVKAPRSAGCRTCVRRRIKCDLTRPRCLHCVKSGKFCTGYAPRIKFVDVGQSVRDQYRGDSLLLSPQQSAIRERHPHRRIERVECSELALAQSTANSEDLTDSSAKPYENSNLPSSDFSTAALIAFVSPTAHQAQLFSKLIESFSPANRFEKHPGDHTWSSWLRELTDHQHSSPSLDSAIRAISLSHLGRTVGDSAIVGHSQNQYGKALVQLNAVLQDSIRGLSLDALIVTIILSFYELQNCTAGCSWTLHAGGSSRLLRLRGAQMHRGGLPRSTLAACRTFLIVQAMVACQPCFLNSPSWRQIFREAAEQAPGDPLNDAIEVFYSELTRHPDYYHAVTMTASTADACVLQSLIANGRALRESFREAFACMVRALKSKNLEPMRVLSNSDDLVFPVIYRYHTTYVGSIHCGYWTALSVMNVTLTRLEDRLKQVTQSKAMLTSTSVADGFGGQSLPPPFGSNSDQSSQSRTVISDSLSNRREYEEECIENSRKACMSVESLSMGPFLGSTFLIYSLRTALLFLESEREREWIRDKMRRLSKNMAIANFSCVAVITTGSA